MDDHPPVREDGPDTGRERDVAAQRRDESSALRDRLAAGRDNEARDWDVKEELADRHSPGMDDLRGRGRASRRRAAGTARRRAWIASMPWEIARTAGATAGGPLVTETKPGRTSSPERGAGASVSTS